MENPPDDANRWFTQEIDSKTSFDSLRLNCELAPDDSNFDVATSKSDKEASACASISKPPLLSVCHFASEVKSFKFLDNPAWRPPWSEKFRITKKLINSHVTLSDVVEFSYRYSTIPKGKVITQKKPEKKPLGENTRRNKRQREKKKLAKRREAQMFMVEIDQPATSGLMGPSSHQESSNANTYNAPVDENAEFTLVADSSKNGNNSSDLKVEIHAGVVKQEQQSSVAGQLKEVSGLIIPENFKDIKYLNHFDGFCWNYFIQEICKNTKCRDRHVIGHSFESILSGLSVEHVIESYNWLIVTGYFKDTLPYYINVLSKMGHHKAILSLVDHARSRPDEERYSLIRLAFYGLVKIGMFVRIAAHMIIDEFKDKIILLAVLEIVIKENDIENDWDVIERIIQNVKLNAIPALLINELIARVVCPIRPSKELCKKVLKEINQNHAVVKLILKDLINPLIEHSK